MGKNSPALFELVRDPGVNQKSMPVAQQVKPVHAAPKPMPTPPAAPATSPKPRIILNTAPKVDSAPAEAHLPAPTPAARPQHGKGPRFVPLTTSNIAIAVVGVVILAVILYATGFNMGRAQEASQARQEMERAGISDPLKAENIPVNPNLVTPAPGSQAGNPARTPPAAQQTPPRQATPAVPASGALADTREVGLNYCVAASRLDQDAAERAAAFIREGGLPAAAVLEGGRSGSNNAGSWKVIVLQGITAQEYRDRAPVRTRVEAELTKLGEVYRKDPKGRIDFGQFAWEKKKN